MNTKNAKQYLVFLILLALPVHADDVTDAIEQASTFYDAGKTMEAINQLDYAAQLIRQARGNALEDFLPEPLAGWSAEEAESASAGSAMLGGGTTVSRNYTRGGATVSVSFVTDSPMLSMFMGFMSNPMIASSQGGKLQTIGGQQAMVNPEGVTMVVANRFLIQVQGSAEQADKIAYAKAINFDGLLSFN